MIGGTGHQNVLPPRLPRPPAIPGAVGYVLPPGVPPPAVVPGGQVVLPPPGDPRPSGAVVPGVGDQEVLPSLPEAAADDASPADEPPLTDSRPSSVRRLIPRPPHSDVSDLEGESPHQLN